LPFVLVETVMTKVKQAWESWLRSRADEGEGEGARADHHARKADNIDIEFVPRTDWSNRMTDRGSNPPPPQSDP
jgi:hypothetical protein